MRRLTVKVWRVAHKRATFDGFPSGPYACAETLPRHVEDALHDMFVAHCDSDHPTPYADRGLRGIDGTERCGFESREALDAWFANFAGLLHECGFRVFAYDVPDDAARVGRCGQVVFSKWHATELERSELTLKPVQLELF
ncbi:hypothetical protein ACWGJW_02555 [Streptomyces nigrescens]